MRHRARREAPLPEALHAAIVFAFLFAPIFVLVVFSFNHARSGTKWTGFSTRWYSDLSHNHEVLQAFRTTIKVAVIATVVATVIGTLAAFALTRYRFLGRAGYSTLVFVSLVMPEIVMGVSMLAFFRRFAHVQLSINTVILAHITFCIAFVVVVVKARLAQFDEPTRRSRLRPRATPAPGVHSQVVVYPWRCRNPGGCDARIHDLA
jgi:spermidine/putrescine transport system permease protein